MMFFKEASKQTRYLDNFSYKIYHRKLSKTPNLVTLAIFYICRRRRRCRNIFDFPRKRVFFENRKTFLEQLFEIAFGD